MGNGANTGRRVAVFGKLRQCGLQDGTSRFHSPSLLCPLFSVAHQRPGRATAFLQRSIYFLYLHRL
jgi:hypothetical protein